MIQIAVKACDGYILGNAYACLFKCRDQCICHYIVGAYHCLGHGELTADNALCELNRSIPPEISVCIITLVIRQPMSLHNMEIGLKALLRLRSPLCTRKTVYLSAPVDLYHVLNKQRKGIGIVGNSVLKEGMLPRIKEHNRLSRAFQKRIEPFLYAFGEESILVIQKPVKLGAIYKAE